MTSRIAWASPAIRDVTPSEKIQYKVIGKGISRKGAKGSLRHPSLHAILYSEAKRAEILSLRSRTNSINPREPAAIGEKASEASAIRDVTPSKKITTENMKKKLIFILLSLIFILTSLPAQAVRTMTANPINIASRLVLYTDSAKVATALQYYGYELSSEATNSPQSASVGLSSGETTIYRHPDGTIIRFSFPKTDSKQTFPTIQVKSKVHKTEAEKILKELGYKKTATGYETISSKFSNYTTSCKFGSSNTITFQRLHK